MAGFLYFLPNTDRQVLSPADFAAAGLAHALDGQGPDCRATTAGPGGAGGIVAVPPCPGGEAPQSRYQPDKQVWRKGPKRTSPDGKDLTWWVGMMKDARPAPADLLRARHYGGDAVRLADGRDWVVPRCVAVLQGRTSSLPQVLDLDDDAETVIARVHPQYRDLCDRAFDWWLDWSEQSEEKDRLTAQQQVDLAVAALAVNYRIGKVEAVGLLGLWGTDEFGLVLRAMIDADAVQKHFDAEMEARAAAMTPGIDGGAEGAAAASGDDGAAKKNLPDAPG